jgi:hypothetical protein
MVSDSVNPYLDDDELAAIYVDIDYKHIIKWRCDPHEKDPISPCPTIVSFEEKSSGNGDTDLVGSEPSSTRPEGAQADFLDTTHPSRAQQTDMRAIIYGSGHPFAFTSKLRMRSREEIRKNGNLDPDQFLQHGEKSGLRDTSDNIQDLPDGPQSEQRVVDDSDHWDAARPPLSASSKHDTRRYEDSVEIYDSYSIVAEESKRLKIAEWARMVRQGRL